ncbi:MAG: wax ester/triacylglycerol synthase family O-acyltransferase [Actinomycetia bacterium]|nr:wax ester/triacylglycerol synthase family O-acyltransferase [Actinomycetes bacterium]
MSTMDAEFLHLEDSVSHMHIAGICTFSDPPPAYDELEAMVASKLHEIPRYRQRVRNVPFELGRPVWVDDPHFSLRYHLRHTALPPPGDEEQLNRLMGRLMSQPLDRSRPLWEAWLVEGLSDDRWALIFKLHHCMVDGVAGVALLEALLDLEADARPGEPEPWTPQPEPAAPALVLDAWAGAAQTAVGWIESIVGAARDPFAGLRRVGELGAGLLHMGEHLSSTPESSLEGPIGPHRRWTHSTVPLERIKDVGHTLGGTVNDVVLTAITLGYRDLLVAHGDDPRDVVVRSLVPVSVRDEAGEGVLDNRVSALLLELPVDDDEPLELFAEVRRRMGDLKGSHMAEFGAAFQEAGDLAPPAVIASLTRLGTLSQHRLTQRSVTTVTTNVPGPQFPLYCLGREMLEYMPFVPIMHGARVGTAILSYNGRVCFGLTGDYDSTPKLDVLADGIVRGIDRLHELT